MSGKRGKHPGGHRWRVMGKFARPGGSKPARQLSPGELERVVAYLQSKRRR